MLKFSSSLPALEGDLESSKGDAKGDPSPYRLSLLGASELQLVRLDEDPEGDCGLSNVLSMSMPSLGPRALDGGSSISDDSPTVDDP